jgi:hypothetical protein
MQASTVFTIGLAPKLPLSVASSQHGIGHGEQGAFATQNDSVQSNTDGIVSRYHLDLYRQYRSNHDHYNCFQHIRDSDLLHARKTLE